MGKYDALIGLFILVAIGVIITLFVMKKQMHTGYYPLYVEYDVLPSISEGAQVRLRGYQIGYVKKIHFTPQPKESEPYFLIELAVKDQYPIMEGTTAEIKSSGFIGEGYVSLNVDVQGAGRLKSSAHLEGITGSDMSRAIARLPEMFDKITTMTRRIGDVRWRSTMHGIGDDMRRIRGNIDGMQVSMHSTLTKTDSLLIMTRIESKTMLQELQENLKTSQTVLEKVSTMVENNDTRIAKALESINSSLTSMNHLMITMDTLMVANRSEIDQILKNLKSATTSLADVAKHPLKALSGGVK